MNLYDLSYDCLMQSNIDKKCSCVDLLYKNWLASKINRKERDKPLAIEIPGRPEKPDLVHPSKLKQRKLGSDLGKATLVHAVVHIEFNAINLALDAVYRFRDMPDEYYTDWLKVAAEEVYHFSLMRKRLQDLGYEYGDMPAHNGLWEMVLKTRHDLMLRMALVPRVLEARGLDVNPAMAERLKKAGDDKTPEILAIILRDEIGHVAIGSHWFKYLCEQRNKNPEHTFQTMIKEHMGGTLHGPLFIDARLQAGFSQQELDELVKLT